MFFILRCVLIVLICSHPISISYLSSFNIKTSRSKLHQNRSKQKNLLPKINTMKPAFNIPPKIRAAVATDYGDDFDNILSVQDDAVATPCIGDKPLAGFRNAVLVRVLAVALAPGDVRVMSGKTREFQGEKLTHHELLCAAYN